MITTEQTYKALRVFFSLYKRGSLNKDEVYTWSRTKQHFDYASDTDPAKATADIMKEYGERPANKSEAHYRPTFAVVHSHMLIPDLPIAEFKGWRAFDVPLFDAITMKQCLSDSPNKKRARRNRDE